LAMSVPREHQVDEYARVIERLGVRVDDRVPRLIPPPPDSPDRETVRRLLSEAGVDGGGRAVVGIHLGTAFGPSKLWPSGRTAELGRPRAGQGGVPLLVGAREDLDTAERLARETGALSLVGRDRPDLLPALVSEVDALVCGDTGVGHLAAALGTPVVALFGP